MMTSLMEAMGPYWFYVAALIKILVVFLGLSLLVAYIVYAERKILAHMQVRIGPMRVGPHGLLQPIADGVKLLLKEDIIPQGADRVIFWLAPLISVIAAFTAFSLIPFGPDFIVAEDVNVGLLFLVGISSLGILGIILGGWASNSHYPLLGALRSTAQLVSYEVALGFSLVSGLLLAGTLDMQGIVAAQAEEGVWFAFVQPVAFFILFVAAIAETNRNPFDLPEAESELVGGFHTEYSGFRFSLYFLAEYAAMVLVSSVAVTLFLGGWLRPFASVGWLNFLDFTPVALLAFAAFWCAREVVRVPAGQEWRWQRLFLVALAAGAAVVTLALLVPQQGESGLEFPVLAALQGVFWFILKVCGFIYGFIWFRGTFPRYRFDQLMNLGWHFMIPLAIVNVLFAGLALVASRSWGWNLAGSLWLGTAATLLVSIPLARRMG